MVTAEFVRSLEALNPCVVQCLWKLSEPISYGEMKACNPITTDYVISSEYSGYLDEEYGVETFLFPADSEGVILSWEELPGSFKGDTDSQKAIGGLLNHMNHIEVNVLVSSEMGSRD